MAEGSTGQEKVFDGRVAIVTGAGAGLGRVSALELAKRGAKVVVNDLGGARDGTGGSQAAADQVVDEIKALGAEAVANYDSVATAEGGQAVVDQAVEAFGKLDILVNNAGILRDKSFAKMEPETWDQVLAVHLHGAYNVTRPAFLQMRENRYGRIIVTTSAAGLHGNFGQTNYSAAKMGLVGFMNTLKIEGEKRDIKVNAVAPVAATRLTEDILPPDLQEKLKPEFIAPLVLFLCSDKCPVTGGIYNAGAGFFSRAALVSGPGAVVGSGAEVPSPEDVAEAMEAIMSLDDPEEFDNATAALGQMMQAFMAAAESSGGGDTAMSPKDVFAKMPEAFQAGNATGVEVVFQYKLSGDGGGAWNVDIKDGTCTVAEGEHASPTTTILMSAEDLIAMIMGDLNPMQAYTSGALKIEGDLMKSQLIEKLFKF